MYYCEIKKRYIIEGEDSADDDQPLAPPPKIGASKPVEPAPQPKEPESGLNSLTQPGFSGALANRNRRKPKAAPGAPMTTFPVTAGTP